MQQKRPTTQQAASVLDRIIQTAPDFMVALRPDGRIAQANRTLATLLGRSPEQLEGESALSFVLPDDRPRLIDAARSLRQGASVSGLQVRVISHASQPMWLQWSAAALDEEALLYAVGRDITQQKRDEQLLRESDQLYRSLFLYTPDAVLALDPWGNFTSLNPACERLSGHSTQELLGTAFLDWVAPECRQAAENVLRRCMQGEFQTHETTIIRRDGTRVNLSIRSAPMVENGVVVGTYNLAHDISAQKRVEAQLAHLAFHDPLTGLANRTLFSDRLDQALARTRRDQPALGLLYLDLDDFKIVNDSLGHRAGDTLLIEAAKRLQSCVGPEDTVARLGGDEFTILLENTNDTDDAIRVAECILGKLATPFEVDGRTMVVTPSVGVVMGNQGKDAKDLLRHADIAMYQAKTKGKARYEAFTPVMYRQALQRLDLESGLRRAIEQQEFRVYYQPVIQLQTGRIIGAEALVRWLDPNRGLIAPGEFIPLAEETGLILPIGKWVLREALSQIRQWRQLHSGLTVSVNLSAKQFLQPMLAEEIAEVLLETEVDAESLELEITETVLMQDAAWTQDTLKILKSIGIGLAMDDFGTGYSSLSYLKRFPIDNLKVDRSFVMGLGQTAEDNALVKTVIGLADSLRLSVTAEGVETAEQMGILRNLGCERGQGFHFAKPLPADEMARLLANQPRWLS